MSDSRDTISARLESLVTRFDGMLRRVGVRYRLNDADIDELVQEVRIRLWRSRPTSELLAAIGASYIYRTAVTAALVVIRRRRTKTHGGDQSLDASHHGVVVVDGSDDRLALSELDEQVERALTGLAPSRQPVVRMYLSGYSREEIADLLGWSEAKTRNLLYRGLADLRSRLTERGIGSEART